MSEITDKMQKRLDSICANMTKKYGKESINYLGNHDIIAIPRLSSQCESLNSALGGGWPIGRIIEIYGAESSGKSTLCYHAIVEAQKLFPDDPVALIDVEYSFDPVYAEALGINVAALLVSQPDDGTDALNILVDLIEQDIKVIIVDSVAALMPKEEADNGIDKQTMGLQARMMSQGLRKINQTAGRKRATVFFTNQTRSKIGVMYGNPETTSGGSALKFYASIRVKVSKIGVEEEGGDKVSSKVRAQVVKNKTAPPFRQAEFNIRFGVGVDVVGGILDAAIEKDIIIKKGGWYSFGDIKLQGKPAVRELLDNDESILKEVEALVKGEITKATEISEEEKSQMADEIKEENPEEVQTGEV